MRVCAAIYSFSLGQHVLRDLIVAVYVLGLHCRRELPRSWCQVRKLCLDVLLPSLVFSQSRLSIIVAAMLMTIVFGRLTLQNGDDCTISRLVKKTREAVINFPCDKVAIGHAGAHFCRIA